MGVYFIIWYFFIPEKGVQVITYSHNEARILEGSNIWSFGHLANLETFV